MTKEDIIKLAREAGLAYGSDEKPLGSVTRFAALVAAAEREAIYKMVLLDTLKDPDLLMQESEVDDNDADDYFKSSDFRYAMNNTVKSTIFTITANIRARKNDAP